MAKARKHRKTLPKDEALPQVENDFGTQQLRDRANDVIPEQPDPNDRSTRRVRVENDSIDWYARRNYISRQQADALRKWQSDAYLAGLMPSCIGQYASAINGGESELSDNRIAALSRRNNAMLFLKGIHKDAVDLVEAVAVRGQSAGRYMWQKYGMPPNEALNMLLNFSTALAKHFGFLR